MDLYTIYLWIFIVVTILFFAFALKTAYDDKLLTKCENDCGDGGSALLEDGKCKCQCQKNWTGEFCEECKPGYYQKQSGGSFIDGKWVHKYDCVRCDSCESSRGEFDSRDGCGYRTNSKCETCPDGYYVATKEQLKTCYTDTTGNCCKCTDCDSGENKTFATECGKDIDATCKNTTCSVGQYINSTGTCSDCDSCSNVKLSSCSKSKNAICADSCPVDTFKNTDGVCTKCTTCTYEEEETGKCTDNKDRICKPCQYGEYYSHLTKKCVKTPCNEDKYWLDMNCVKSKSTDEEASECCKPRTVCPPGKIQTSVRSFTSDSKCGIKCESNDFHRKIIRGVETCIPCTKCQVYGDGSTDVMVSNCLNSETGDESRTNDTDRVCMTAGHIPYPYSKNVCAKCKPETTPPLPDSVRMKKCESAISCTEENRIDTCNIPGLHNSFCVDGKCDIDKDYWCENDVLDKCKDTTGLTGTCSQTRDSNWVKTSDGVFDVPKSLMSPLTPIKEEDLPLGKVTASVNLTDGTQWKYNSTLDSTSGDICYVYDGRGKNHDLSCGFADFDEKCGNNTGKDQSQWVNYECHQEDGSGLVKSGELGVCRRPIGSLIIPTPENVDYECDLIRDSAFNNDAVKKCDDINNPMGCIKPGRITCGNKSCYK